MKYWNICSSTSVSLCHSIVSGMYVGYKKYLFYKCKSFSVLEKKGIKICVYSFVHNTAYILSVWLGCCSENVNMFKWMNESFTEMPCLLGN